MLPFLSTQNGPGGRAGLLASYSSGWYRPSPFLSRQMNGPFGRFGGHVSGVRKRPPSHCMIAPEGIAISPS